MKEARHKRLYWGTKNRSGVGGGSGGRDWTKGQERIFWGDKNILYLDCSNGYNTVYVCQNT